MILQNQEYHDVDFQNNNRNSNCKTFGNNPSQNI